MEPFNINLTLPEPRRPEPIIPPAFVKPPEKEKRPVFHKENVVVGVELNNYDDRRPSEDGKYVHMVHHEEWIEMIRQPLTPEEIQAQADRRQEAREEAQADREQNKAIAKVFAGALVVSAGILGVAVYFGKLGKVVQAVEAVSE